MRFKSVLKKIITEQSRFQVLFDKMVKPKAEKEGKPGKPKGLMEFETLKTIIMADPTTKAPENFDVSSADIEEMEKVKVGKYTQWLLKNFVVPSFGEEEKGLEPGTKEYSNAVKRYRELFLEDLHKVTSDLQEFEKVKQYLPQESRDINKLTPKSLYVTIRDFKLPEKKQKELEKKQVKKTRSGFSHAGGEILFEGNDWTLIRISDKGATGKDAAVWYGGYQDSKNDESRWCTSAPGLTYFETYIKNGPLYVVFPNNDKGEIGKRTGLPKERYQFHFPSSQFMDRDDHQINLVDFLNNKAKELKEFFKFEFAKGLTTSSGEKMEINYPNSSAGKFVALYGFDELFETAPDTITNLIIVNSSRDEVALDVPSSLGKFKKLEALVLDNMVKTLPGTIADLKNLSFLSLPNNKKLESLPETLVTTDKDGEPIVSLPELAFINLKDSNPNVIIPETLKELMLDQGNGFYYVS